MQGLVLNNSETIVNCETNQLKMGVNSGALEGFLQL